MAFKKGNIPWNVGMKGFNPSPGTLFKKGNISWNTGKAVYGKCIECGSRTSIWTKREQPKRCRKCHYKSAFTIKELHPRWKKDRDSIKVQDTGFHDPRRKQWTRDVKNRDGWLCKMANEDCAGGLEAHHILRWSDFPELRYELNNGITLCHAHHPRKKSEEARLSPYFVSLIT